MLPLVGILGSLLGGLTEIAKGWQERQTIRAESQARIEEARATAAVRSLERNEEAGIAWDKSAVDQMSTSWKDEFYVILLSVPLIMAFVPGLVQYVRAGFEVLDTMPDWYKAAVGVAVAASFGYRKFADYMTRKADKS